MRQDWPGELEMNERAESSSLPSSWSGLLACRGKQEKELAYVLGKKRRIMRPITFRALAGGGAQVSS